MFLACYLADVIAGSYYQQQSFDNLTVTLQYRAGHHIDIADAKSSIMSACVGSLWSFKHWQASNLDVATLKVVCGHGYYLCCSSKSIQGKYFFVRLMRVCTTILGKFGFPKMSQAKHFKRVLLWSNCVVYYVFCVCFSSVKLVFCFLLMELLLFFFLRLNIGFSLWIKALPFGSAAHTAKAENQWEEQDLSSFISCRWTGTVYCEGKHTLRSLYCSHPTSVPHFQLGRIGRVKRPSVWVRTTKMLMATYIYTLRIL